MKTDRFKTTVLLILLTVWIGGCASSPPPERPDSEKIKRNSEKSMKDLKNEEDQRSNGY